jgi:RNA polymerase sigma-70 factor (ECF subfamily)
MVIRKAYNYVTKKKDVINIEDSSAVNLSAPVQGDTDYIERAILSLPYKSRCVFVMAEIEGYSHKEIAAELEITVGTSKSQLNYAKTKLKNILSEYLVE